MHSAQKRRIGQISIDVFKLIGVVFLFAILVQTVANVTARYVLGHPIQGTVELVSYWYLPVVVFLGFIISKDLDEQLEAPLVFDRLTVPSQRVLTIINSGLVVATSLFFAYFTFVEAKKGFDIGTTAGLTSYVIWPVMFLIPLAFAGLALQYCLDIVHYITRDSGDMHVGKVAA